MLTREIQVFEKKKGSKNVEKRKFTFWESLTGLRYEQQDPRVHYLYRTIGSCFNHANFYANVQSEDQAFKVSLELENMQKWKNMLDPRTNATLERFQIQN